MTQDFAGRAAIYARISRDKKDDGDTIAEQIRLCRELAVKHNLEVVAVYPEKDGTGASEKSQRQSREKYDEMLSAAEAGEFGTILAYSDDRLTRRPVELEELIRLVERTGLRFHTVRTSSYDLATTQGITLARILGSIAAGEARTISDRQRVTFERNAREGKPKLQRQRAFGWEDDGVTIREDEARVIRQGIAMLKDGATITQVAQKWNQQGIRTAVDPAQSKQEVKPDGQWEWTVVHRVLTGWRTVGVRTYRRQPQYDSEGNLVMGNWEPIISMEDREEALTMLSRLSRKKIRTGSWPLAGILRCGECFKPLYGQLPSGTRGRALYGCKKGHLAISAGLVEQYIIRLVHQRAHDHGKDRVEVYRPVLPTDWPRHDELASVVRKKQELKAAYLDDKISGDFVFDLADELDKRAESLQKELDDFMAEQFVPPNPWRRSSDALEDLLEKQGRFLRVTPKPTKSAGGPRWGERDELEESNAWSPLGETQDPGAAAEEAARPPARMQELPFAATPEETAELNRLLRSVLRHVGIKKGKAGRQSAAQFEARVDPVWR